MPDSSAQIQDVYDFAVTADHQTGDIWADLSCLGLLGDCPVGGIVITPACDLSNRKVETITYLPILPVFKYFGSPAVLPMIIRMLNGQLDVLGIDSVEQDEPFTPIDTELLRSHLANHISKGLGDKEKLALERADSGASVLEMISGARQVNKAAIARHLRSLAGREYGRIMREIVKNSYRPELHFLPHDRQLEQFSGVPDHSLVLFRYPITVPTALLDSANSCDARTWPARCANLAQQYPIARTFSARQPQKRSRVKARFMADLITRFLSLYLRLGSPDFHDRLVDQFVSELDHNV